MGSSRVRSVLGAGAYGLVLVGLPALQLYRALLVNGVLSRILGSDAGALLPVLVNDARLVGPLLLLGAAALAPWRWPARLARPLLLLGVLAFGVDVALNRLLQRRLLLGDVLRFGGEVRQGITLLEPLGHGVPGGAWTVALLLAVGLVAFVAGILLPPREAGWRRFLFRASLAGGALVLLAGLLVPARPGFHQWAYRNVVDANLPRGVETPYSPGFAEEVARRASRPPAVRPGANRRLDVVLLVVESLSSSQSRLFSGLADMTPRLDRIAEENVAFTRFISNAYATHLGLVALLLGRVPLPPAGPDLGESFERYGRGDSLAAVLKKAGYRTAYLATSNLAFLDKGRWLRALGFDSIEGHDAPDYASSNRLAFEAPPDAALYQAALVRVRRLRAEGRPFLLCLETTSSHLPWTDPDGTASTEERVMRYVDAQIGAFHDALRASGYFGHGILLVTGDHRLMAPVTPAESRRFGTSAYARIPLVAVGAGLAPRRVDAPFQQADVIRSLECEMTEACPVDSWRGDFLADPPVPPVCVFHPLVNERELVWVRCGGSEGLVRLDGDATGVADGNIPAALVPRVVEAVNSWRIER